MLEQRTRGCLWVLGWALTLANAGLFGLFLLAERQIGFYGLVADASRVVVYLLAAPVSIFYSRPILRESLQRVKAPSLWHSFVGSLHILVLQALTIFGLYFLLKDVGLSRAFLLSYLGIAFGLNLVLLYVLPTLITRAAFQDPRQLRAIVYGFGPLPDDLREYLSRAPAMGINLIGYYAEEKLSLPGVEWLGTTREVMTCEGGRKRIRAELAFAFCGTGDLEAFREGVDLCTRRGARVHIYSNISSTFVDPVRVVTEGKLLFFSFFDEPLQNPVNQFLKRGFDIVVSLPVVLFVLPPLTLLVWLMQRIQSPGPVFFRQTRYGINRRPFTILKYRTMHVQDRSAEGKQATRGDPRIYGFGRFLRKSSLDEFPQFLNALRGDMSVVGPRPHLTLHDDEFERYFRRYRSRHYVKPGITGLAQVSGYRGETRDAQAIIGRVQHDLRYIAQWSIGMEIYIFLKTAWQVFFPPKSAY